MNKITEVNIFPVHNFLVNGQDNGFLPLHFDFVSGALSFVPEGYSTFWRQMPFHMISMPTGGQSGVSSVMRMKNDPPLHAEAPAVLFMPANTLHRIDDYGAERNCIWIHFRLLTMHKFDFFSHHGIKPFVSREGFVPVYELLKKLLDTCRRPQTIENMAWVQIYGISLALKIFELSGIEPGNMQTAVTGNKSRIAPALKILEKSLIKPDLDTLAAAVHLSPSRFLAIFREEMGASPGKYYRQVQFIRACKMLADSATTVSACAAKLGFADAFHFSREFHKLSGLSPREYRKQLY